jgi:hypothetical protein
MDRLDAGLMTAIASGPGGEGGVRASATELSILSRGTSVDTAGASAAAAPSDLQRTRVRFDPASGTITLATTDAVLAVPSTLPEPLVHGVARFVARCADGARWRDEFDSAERGRLPAAVLVAVWFNASDDATPPDAMRLIAVPDAQTPAAPGRE